MAVDRAQGDELLEVNEALDRLAQVDRESAELVKLRYFGGLSLTESAAVMGISSRTADRRWAYARAWLHQELAADEKKVEKMP
jgi:DNA-directed RNA polymerase specialized sigma24 family protein